MIRFSERGLRNFDADIIRRVYDSTTHGDPLRKLMRDECVYEEDSTYYMDLYTNPVHPEFTRDVMVELLRLRNHQSRAEVENVYKVHDSQQRSVDKCRYHQHNETHPRCSPELKKKPSFFD